jgi:hypothetical protein
LASQKEMEEPFEKVHLEVDMNSSICVNDWRLSEHQILLSHMQSLGWIERFEPAANYTQCIS